MLPLKNLARKELSRAVCIVSCCGSTITLLGTLLMIDTQQIFFHMFS